MGRVPTRELAECCMDINETKLSGRFLFTLNGRLDSATNGLLDERLTKVINDGELQIVIDCSQLHYLSSAGVRVLLTGIKKLSPKGGRIILAAMRVQVREVMLLGGFDSVFPHFETVDEALKA